MMAANGVKAGRARPTETVSRSREGEVGAEESSGWNDLTWPCSGPHKALAAGGPCSRACVDVGGDMAAASGLL